MSTPPVSPSSHNGMEAHPSCEKIFCTLISNPYNLMEGNEWYHTLAKVLLTALVILTTAFMALIPIIMFALDDSEIEEEEDYDSDESDISFDESYDMHTDPARRLVDSIVAQQMGTSPNDNDDDTSSSESSDEDQDIFKDSSTGAAQLIAQIIKGIDDTEMQPGESPGAYVDPEGDPVPVTDATSALINQVLRENGISDSI